MSFYRDHIYPQLVSRHGDPEPIRKIRQQIVRLAKGDVLEIGVGPGVNFPHCDCAQTTKVYTLEPNSGMIRLAENLHRHHRQYLHHVDHSRHRDAIREMKRVVKPGSKLVFFERGLPPNLLCNADRNGWSHCFDGIRRLPSDA